MSLACPWWRAVSRSTSSLSFCSLTDMSVLDVARAVTFKWLPKCNYVYVMLVHASRAWTNVPSQQTTSRASICFRNKSPLRSVKLYDLDNISFVLHSFKFLKVASIYVTQALKRVEISKEITFWTVTILSMHCTQPFRMYHNVIYYCNKELN